MTSVVGRWDRGRLEQALTCLLDNALKFGAGKPIEIEVARAGANGRLVVRDHGIGLAPEQLPRIFRRFEHAAPAHQYGGLGLGLFIVHEIVAALGGQVDVESAVGVGSTFAIRPRMTRSAPMTASGKGEVLHSQGKARTGLARMASIVKTFFFKRLHLDYLAVRTTQS